MTDAGKVAHVLVRHSLAAIVIAHYPTIVRRPRITLLIMV